MTQTGPVWDPGEKSSTDENFPVASRLIAKRYRTTILSFYRFARAADDIADHPSLSEDEKIGVLDQFEDTLLGKTDVIADALPLREACDKHKLTVRHGQDLLVAFRWDASKHRYLDWPDLMRYCSYSAMPVGRFVLDVHGENHNTWVASDALCAALQVINHLQDCGHDYRRLGRVYLPSDSLAAHNAQIEELAEAKASLALLGCIRELNFKTKELLGSADLSGAVRNIRLGLEVAAIERLARKLISFLEVRDPLSERVHLGKSDFAAILLTAVTLNLGRRILRPFTLGAYRRRLHDQPDIRG